jgi:hypothetical protein
LLCSSEDSVVTYTCTYTYSLIAATLHRTTLHCIRPHLTSLHHTALHCTWPCVNYMTIIIMPLLPPLSFGFPFHSLFLLFLLLLPISPSPQYFIPLFLSISLPPFLLHSRTPYMPSFPSPPSGLRCLHVSYTMPSLLYHAVPLYSTLC